MVESTIAERAVVVAGIVPLLVAAGWLLVLREPAAAVASAATPLRADPPELSVVRGAASFVGVVVAGQEAELGAEVGGEVVRVYKDVGDPVRRGEPLLQLAALSVAGARKLAHAQTLEDNATISSARYAQEAAHDLVDRMLHAPNAYSERDLRKAQNDARRASVELDRLRASASVHRAVTRRDLARADKQVVRAPFDGVLAARAFDLGDFVTAGAVLARVVDGERLVRFALPTLVHGYVQAGDQVRIQSQDSADVVPAAVVGVDPEIDSASGLGFARARVPARAVHGTRFAPGNRVAVFLSPRELQ
ncbi:MAG: hypothetical protein RL701_1031 [Pseudomonadota bacterium]|jgi:RND family efflux transporter MFP subunit